MGQVTGVRGVALAAVGASVCWIGAAADAGLVYAVGGMTSVLFDLETLQSQAGLVLTRTSEAVVTPGNLGPDSFGFVITPPIASDHPTTFAYDPADFADTYSGGFGHRGSVVFNHELLFGNLDAIYDGVAFRFIETVSGYGELFDLFPAPLTPGVDRFVASGELRISQNLAQLLIEWGLTREGLAGLVVGTALIEAYVVPAPGPVSLLVAASLFLGGARRRRPGGAAVS